MSKNKNISKEIKDCNQEKSTIILKDSEPKYKFIVQSVISFLSLVISLIGVLVSYYAIAHTVPDAITTVTNQMEQNNQQTNEQISKQTQVVIEPRDGDIIVKDGTDYKLLQLINIDDITFPTKIQEIQYSKNQCDKTRKDILNKNLEDWSQRDSFVYVINNFSINPNKVINLLDNIKSIQVFCDFYSEKNITTYIDLGENAFSFPMRSSIEDLNFEVTKQNISSTYQYVTKEVNDGIEWVKIRVEIVYQIGTREISDTLTSDWIATDADIM